MKRMTAILLVSGLLAGCRSPEAVAPVKEISFQPDMYEAGTLIPVEESNATDTLVVTIDVDPLIHEQKTEWPYRRLTTREQVELGGRALGMNADGGGGGYGLYLTPSSTGAVEGTNIEFAIRYYGSQDQTRYEGEATINVPVAGVSSGQVKALTWKSEWRPNHTSDGIRQPAFGD